MNNECICENGFLIERTERVLRIELCSFCVKIIFDKDFKNLESVIRKYLEECRSKAKPF